MDLLNEIKRFGIPSVLCTSAIIAAAFRNNDNNLGWQLLQEMIGKSFCYSLITTCKLSIFH